jgi:UDP-glucose 4-epimerase
LTPSKSPGEAAQDYRDRRVVVLGASGFVGRWVARALTDVGARLTLVVRRLESSQRLFDGMGIQGDIRQVDLHDGEAIQALFQDVRPSVTFNLAGYGVDRAERDRDESFSMNTELVRVLCRHAAEHSDDWNGLTLVHAGSALEYGGANGDLHEGTTPAPTTMYGQSKLEGTLAVQQACRAAQLLAVVARLFTVYGAGEHDGRLLPALLESAGAGRALPLTSGTQLRDFTYVEDVASGLLRLGTIQAASGLVVNLATGKLLSVRDFALQTAQVLRLDKGLLGFGQLPGREEEMAHNSVNINRLKALTGWRPPSDIATGVQRTLAWIGGRAAAG